MLEEAHAGVAVVSGVWEVVWEGAIRSRYVAPATRRRARVVVSGGRVVAEVVLGRTWCGFGPAAGNDESTEVLEACVRALHRRAKAREKATKSGAK